MDNSFINTVNDTDSLIGFSEAFMGEALCSVLGCMDHSTQISVL